MNEEQQFNQIELEHIVPDEITRGVELQSEDSVEDFFWNCKRGMRLTIDRTRPKYAGVSGHLETVYLNGAGHYSMDLLRETHGGGTFLLKKFDGGKYLGCITVEVAGTPMVDGIPVERPKPVGQDSTFRDFLPIMQNSQKDVLSLMQKMLSETSKSARPSSGIDDLAKMAQFLESIRPRESQQPQSEIMPMVATLASAFLANKNQQQAQPVVIQPPRIAQQRPVQELKQAPIAANPAKTPQTINQNQNNLDNDAHNENDSVAEWSENDLCEIADEVASMPQEKIQMLLGLVVSRLSPDQISELSAFGGVDDAPKDAENKD